MAGAQSFGERWRGLGRDTRNRLLLLAGAGIAAPWITGAGVKLYLDAHGQPTYPWLSFFHPIAVLIAIPGTLVWASPFIVLASLALALQRWPFWPWLTPTDRWLIAYGGLLVGLWGEVRLFVEVFWTWDAIALFAGFLLVPVYVPYLLAGLGLGTVVALARVVVRRVWS